MRATLPSHLQEAPAFSEVQSGGAFPTSIDTAIDEECSDESQANKKSRPAWIAHERSYLRSASSKSIKEWLLFVTSRGVVYPTSRLRSSSCLI